MSSAAVRADWVGRVVEGRFTLLKWLGGSEWSDVFLTELQGNPSRKAAIKLIPVDATDAEAQIAGWAVTTTFSHPHLMRLFHTGSCQIGTIRLLYVVMEYAEENLSQIIPERPLTSSEAKEMLTPVLEALAYLHGRGFVHGHLKPSNIMVVDDQLKLSLDTAQVAGESSQPRPGQRVRPGQPVYDAPEAGTRPVSPAADVWSLGMTLVEALTQHPPVRDPASRTEPFVPEAVPQPFFDIARECLRPDPERRCILDDIVARLEPAQSLPQATDTTRRPPLSKRWIVFAAVVLVPLTIFAIWELRSHRGLPSQPTGKQESTPAIAALPPQSAGPGTQPSGVVVEGTVSRRVLPDVPRSARNTIQGKIKVSVEVNVDPSGEVESARFTSHGSSKYFANLALRAAREWKFEPARVNGEAVASVWVLRFSFGKAAITATPTEVSPSGKVSTGKVSRRRRHGVSRKTATPKVRTNR